MERERLFPPHEPVDLVAMCEQVEKLRREHPEPPLRWDVAPDVYADMCERWPAEAPLPNPLQGFAGFYGVRVVLCPRLAAGEYAPVYSCRRGT